LAFLLLAAVRPEPVGVDAMLYAQDAMGSFTLSDVTLDVTSKP
jgi:hypothetical protein